MKNLNQKITVLLMLPFLWACSEKHNHVHNSPAPSPESSQETDGGVIVEGVINGGGGKGVLCQRGDQQVLEVLDIYEGRSVYGQSYEKIENLKFEELKVNLLQKFYDHFSGGVTKSYEDEDNPDPVQKILDEAKFTSEGQSLKSTNDSDEAFVAQGCELVQIAVYYDEAVLIIDKKLWEQLDDFNKVALLIHEGIYSTMRRMGETNSISTRRLLSHLISDQGLQSVWGEGFPGFTEDVLTCYQRSKERYKSEFYLYQDGDDVRLVYQGNDSPNRFFYTHGIVKDVELERFRPPYGDIPYNYVGLQSEASSLTFGELSFSNASTKNFFYMSLTGLRSAEDVVNQEVSCYPANGGITFLDYDFIDEIKQGYINKTYRAEATDLLLNLAYQWSLKMDSDLNLTRTFTIKDKESGEAICQQSFDYVFEHVPANSDSGQLVVWRYKSTVQSGDLEKELFAGHSCKKSLPEYEASTPESLRGFNVQLSGNIKLDETDYYWAE